MAYGESHSHVTAMTLRDPGRSCRDPQCAYKAQYLETRKQSYGDAILAIASLLQGSTSAILATA